MTNLVTKCKLKEEWWGGGGGGILWYKVTNIVTKCKVKEEWSYFVAQGDKPCHKVYGERGMVGVGGLFCGTK